MFVGEYQYLLSQRTQLTEHYTFSCHLLHVSAVLAIFRWIVLVLTINTVQYRDCAISKCFSSRCIWDWYCSLTSGVIKQVPASYLALPFLFILSSLLHLSSSSSSLPELGSIISASHGVGYGRYCRLGSEHRWRCILRKKTLIFTQGTQFCCSDMCIR